MRSSLLLPAVILLPAATLLPAVTLPAAVPNSPGGAIEFRDGERVALIGGTLIEREQRYGYWEYALTAAHPDKQIVFRNLGWSGDTVWAESRGIFDPPEKGYQRLLEQVQELRPTLFLLNYGSNEAWGGAAGLDRFLSQYGKLIDDLTAAVKQGDAAGGGGAAATQTGGGPRFLLLGPLPMEGGVGPNRDPSAYNAEVARYADAIAGLAKSRQIPFVDLRGLFDWNAQFPDHRALTDNGVHLSEFGYWQTAPWIREQLCRGATRPAVLGATPEDTARLQARFVAAPARTAIMESPGFYRIDAVPPAMRTSDHVCLEFRGLIRPLPDPLLDGYPPTWAPTMRFELATPGHYRVEIDGEVVAEDHAPTWSLGVPFTLGPDDRQADALLTAIRRKNELYFHRWRPQNITYLFLFRKHEQGQNAVEIPQFDPLIEAEEARIAALRVPQVRTIKLIRSADGNP